MSAKEFSPGAIAEGNMEWAGKVAKMVENLGNIDFEFGQLEDVEIQDAADGDVIKYDDGKFVNSKIGLDDMDDVEITEPENGEILRYYDGKFVNVPLGIVKVRFFEEDDTVGCNYDYDELVNFIDLSEEFVCSYKGSNYVSYEMDESENIIVKFIVLSAAQMDVVTITVADDDSITKSVSEYVLTAVQSQEVVG